MPKRDRDEPRKVVYMGREYFCPVCGMPLRIQKNEGNFCAACGQALDYSTEEEARGATVIRFPIAVGETVKCVVKDEENRVTLLPYTVRGVAFLDGKYYAINPDGDLCEVDTGDCLACEERMASDRWDKET